ncbi:hypothetical protein RWE15_09465 [Virgibacillus halophilus]|uniref:Amidohydrolase family protein n=1 Tax=Tigheibacillus halophilus TaxID=361280 RepID=A0ABU5C5M9_9BACI|nr:hypothetical protein [Virgibacillus halophilus]
MEKDHTHSADLIIDNCSILTSAFEFKNNQCIVIKNKKIEAIGDQSVLAGTYHAAEQLSGKGKLVMPGLIDAHTHTNQQLLRGENYR